MPTRTGWTRDQLLVAFSLYCQMPFGRMHKGNPQIIELAERIGRTPSALAMKLSNIASLDPEITSTGRKGLPGASTADRAMWEEMSSDWEGFALIAKQAELTFGINEVDEKQIAPDIDDYHGKEKLTKTKQRVGQNFFRRTVLSSYDYRCCITGLSVPQLLIASHIVPWHADPQHRLNPQNGLCLSMLHDKAFDIGMITISEEMTVDVSERLNNSSDEFLRNSILSYQGKPVFLPEKFSPDIAFLAHHRSSIFQG